MKRIWAGCWPLPRCWLPLGAADDESFLAHDSAAARHGPGSGDAWRTVHTGRRDARGSSGRRTRRTDGAAAFDCTTGGRAAARQFAAAGRIVPIQSKLDRSIEVRAGVSCCCADVPAGRCPTDAECARAIRPSAPQQPPAQARCAGQDPMRQSRESNQLIRVAASRVPVGRLQSHAAEISQAGA